MVGPHIGPVTASAPALGTIRIVLLSLAARAIAMATPECTVPTITSTLSRLIRRFTLSVALAGSDSSSTLKYSISRPASLPPCSPTYMRKPFSMATPSAAKVPLAGSMKPTLIFSCASTGPLRAASVARASAPFRLFNFHAVLVIFCLQFFCVDFRMPMMACVGRSRCGECPNAGLHATASRSRKRWILPVAVLGSSSTNSMKRGYL